LGVANWDPCLDLFSDSMDQGCSPMVVFRHSYCGNTGFCKALAREYDKASVKAFEAFQIFLSPNITPKLYKTCQNMA